MALTKDTLSAFENYKTTLGTDEVIVGNEKVVFAEMLPDSKIKEYVEPTVCFTKWNKEESLTLLYPTDTGFSDKTLVDGELKLSADDEEFYFRQHDDNTFKFGLILNKIPDKSHLVTIDGIEYYQWQFKLVGWENFDFWYQEPWLNFKDIGNGYIEKTDGEMLGSKRKIETQGSYAVYHKTKKNYVIEKTNYETGKFCHIFRPKFIDANNNWIWADLSIVDGFYTVILPQAFLNSAVYPVKANDTFGYTSIGANSGTPSDKYCGTQQVLAVAGDITKISMYLSNGIYAQYYNLGLYDNSSNRPNNRLSEGSEGIVPENDTGHWFDRTQSYSFSANTFWLVAGMDGNTVTYYWDDASGVSLWNVGTYASGSSLPSPFTAGGDSGTLRFSIYATYTPSGGAAPVPYGYLSTNKGFW